jgi:hypothetical protein
VNVNRDQISINVTPDPRNNELTSVHDVEMRRPANPGDQATWDRMFQIGFPGL